MTGVWTRGALCLLLAAVLSAGISISSAVAQEASTETGAIAGVVVDKKNGKSLPGANVSIKGTTTGTTTDVKGRYRLTGLKPGTYDILFSFVGFQDKTVTGIKVKPGETTTLDITLAEKTAQMEEVVVKAQAARDTEAGMLKDRAKAAGVTNAISAETISQSGSSTAADAVEKVTGVSVTGGQFINVRGMGGRYVNTQLNGAALPSADPNRNAVPLDLFPAGLLDNISTQKTFRPDRPGTSTGANVNLQTKSFPEEQTLSLSTSFTYDSEVAFNDVLRQDGGLENVPSSVQGGVPTDLGEVQRLDEATSSFSSGKLSPRESSGPVNQSYSASYGNQFEIFGDRPLGLVAGAKYSRGTSAIRNQKLAGAGSATQNTVGTDFSFTGESGTTTETIGAVANFSFKPSPSQEISLNTLFNQTSETSAVFLSGTVPRDKKGTFRRRRIEPIDRRLWSVQGDGEHLLGEGKDSPRLTWNSSFSQTQQDESDVRFFTDDRQGNDFNISTSIYERPTRYFRELTEFTWSNDLALSIPFATGEVKVGGRYLLKDRDLNENRFNYTNLDAVPYDGNPDTYFDECAGEINAGECNRTGAPGTGGLGVIIQDRTDPQNNITGEREVGAGFAMLDSEVPGISKLRFIGGVRVERTSQSVKTQSTAEEPSETGEIQVTDVLPSANFVYSVREDMNVRVAYGRTIALPSFREFSPSAYYDFKRQEIITGNLSLERTTVHNIDLRWEWFTGPGELYSLTGYYKYLDQPIEKEIVEAANNREVRYVNQQSAQVYGLELEARQNLGFLADELQYVQIGGNLTLTSSSVTGPNGNDLGRPLEGQSDYLLNADATYDNPESGTTLSVFYNFFSERLDTIERENQPNQFERGRHTIDVVASQQLPYGLKMKASVKNLLNEKFELYQDFPSREFTTVQYSLGRTFSLGFSYNL